MNNLELEKEIDKIRDALNEANRDDEADRLFTERNTGWIFNV